MNEIRLHSESIDAFFSRASKAAREIDAGTMVAAPASLAFETTEGLLKVLTPNRWTLLRKLRASGSSSIRALAQALGRDYRGVHADVTALLETGLIEKAGDGRISVPWERITAEMSLGIAA